MKTIVSHQELDMPDDDGEEPDIDPYEFMDAVDISSKILANFYTQMESKKWGERKEALDNLEKVTAAPKIVYSEQLGDLVRTLKKTITKDNNIVVATSAAKCLCQLAQGLRTKFAPLSHGCLSIIIEKFKEKKPQVVSVLRDTADAIFASTNLEAIQDDITTHLDNKNPQIKSELCLFLARAFANQPQQLLSNKKVIKPLVTALMKTLSDMDATVRDTAAQALGTMMKVLGDRVLMPLFADLEELKIKKIKEHRDKAEIKVTQRPAAVNAKIATTNGVVPGTEAANQPGADGAEDEPDVDPYDLMDAIDISNKIPANFYTQMESKKWGERKEALDNIEKLTATPKIEYSEQLGDLVRTLKKTITKDSNIVVATSASRCMCQLAQGLRVKFAPLSHGCLGITFEKFKEKKPQVVSVLRDTADALFVCTNLEAIQEDITTYLDNKNPQIKSELCLFLARAFANHPEQLLLNKKVIKPLVTALMKTLSDMDVTVRDNSAQALGTMMKALSDRVLMPLLADLEELKIKKIREQRDKAQVKNLPRSVLIESKPPAIKVPMQAPQAVEQVQPTPQQLPQQIPSSTATFVRPKMRQKLGQVRSTGYGQQPAAATASSNNSSASSATSGPTMATVKRTNTIVKQRSMLPQSGAMSGSTANIDNLAQQMSQVNIGSTMTKSLPKPGTLPSRTNSGLSGRSLAAKKGLPVAKPTFAPSHATVLQVNQNTISSTPIATVNNTHHQTNSDEYKASPQLEFNNHSMNNIQSHDHKDPDANLNQILGLLTSQNTNQALEAFQQLENLLTQSETQELFINRVDQVIGFCSNHLRMIHETLKDSRRLNPSATLPSNTSIRFVKAVSTTLIALFNSRSLAMLASPTPLSDLMKQIFILLASSPSTHANNISVNNNGHISNNSDMQLNTSANSPNSTKYSIYNSSEDEASVNKNLNLLAASAIKAVDPTTMLCLLIGLLVDSLQVCVSSVHVATNELIMKGLWRMTRKIGSGFGQLDIERVLAEIYCFMETFPPSYWKSGEKRDDTPMKTIKTLIYSLTESLGNSIYNYMDTVPNECEMRTYIKRALIQCEREKAQSPVQKLIDAS